MKWSCSSSIIRTHHQPGQELVVFLMNNTQTWGDAQSGCIPNCIRGKVRFTWMWITLRSKTNVAHFESINHMWTADCSPHEVQELDQTETLRSFWFEQQSFKTENGSNPALKLLRFSSNLNLSFYNSSFKFCLILWATVTSQTLGLINIAGWRFSTLFRGEGRRKALWKCSSV